MCSGKSLDVYKIYDNYKRQGKKTICFVPEVVGETKSRLGFEVPSILIKSETNIYEEVLKHMPINCVLVEEVQFIKKEHVIQLSQIVDNLNVPVIAYGLKNGYKNTLFEGSYWLLVYADKVEEVKTTCMFCDTKATMVLRIKDGLPVYDGEDILIEEKGKTDYLPVCRKHWNNPDFVMLRERFNGKG